VITCSDKGAAGQREDLSGPKAKELLEAAGYEVIETIIIPDDQKTIEKELIRFSDARNACLIVTTGGTGFSPKDVTPEATLAVAHRQAQGIAQAILVKSLQITDKAMLSRAVSVIRGQSVIVNLPGSPKAVQESLEIILPALEHGIKTLRGVDSECAAPLSEKVH
jgi:molybdenum cofactor synthesis domain-containing protein